MSHFSFLHQELELNAFCSLAMTPFLSQEGNSDGSAFSWHFPALCLAALSFDQLMRSVFRRNHRVIEWFGSEGTLKTICWNETDAASRLTKRLPGWNDSYMWSTPAAAHQARCWIVHREPSFCSVRVVKEEQGYGFPGVGTVDFATSVLFLNISSWDSGE